MKKLGWVAVHGNSSQPPALHTSAALRRHQNISNPVCREEVDVASPNHCPETRATLKPSPACTPEQTTARHPVTLERREEITFHLQHPGSIQTHENIWIHEIYT